MKINLENIAVVLQEPHYPENIGAAVRAAKNMGISRVLTVSPAGCDLTRILKTATHHAQDLVLGIEVHERLEDALKPFQYVVGTTARRGSHRQTVRNPRELSQDLIPISQKNQVALLFGPEASGLANEHTRYCDVLVTIPTCEFSSINLAQAVMIMVYELFTAASETKAPFVPRLATRFELESMYAHVKETLSNINFLSADNPDYRLESIRRFFSRMQVRGKDVQLIRGICRQIEWYCFKRQK
ncbi:MAG: TrmJ/YjtD family RNA methyltransferase [Syntrophobacteraceae bacterium]|nr:TrmJ/YjtD family RNA methyltransferase [Syntrophobacteraceae bacterium]